MTSDTQPETPEERERRVLSSPEYEQAWRVVMEGSDVGLLDDSQRALLREAREVTGHSGPGYPLPWRMDRTGRDAP